MKRLKWILTVVGTALLVLSVVAAWLDVRAQDHARREAGARIEAARVAASAELLRIVGEARDALRGWTPGAELKAPLTHAWPAWGEEANEIDEHLLGDVGVVFGRRGQLDVFIEVPQAGGGTARLRGRVPGTEIRRRIAAQPGVGPIGRNWAWIAVADHRGVAIFVMPGPTDALQADKPEWERFRDSGALPKIGQQLEGPLDGTGAPPRYRGAEERMSLGVWAPLEQGARLHVLVEVVENDALGDLAGYRIGFGDRELVRLQPWHGMLAVSLLALFVAMFVWVAGRYAELSPLARVYTFARPYTVGIGVTIGMGALFSVAQNSRMIVLKKLADDVLVRQGPDAKDQLVMLALATVVLGVAMAVSTFFKDFLQNYYATAMMNDVRLAVGARMVTLPLGFFQRFRAGDLVSRLERDVVGMRALLTEVFDTGFVQPFILVGSLVVAFVMNPRLALVLFGMPLIVVPLFRIARKLKKRAQKRQLLFAEISHLTFQILSGIKVVKAFGGEKHEVDRLTDAKTRFMHEARKIQRLSALSKALLDLLQMAGGAILVYVGGVGVLESTVSLGDLMAFMLVVQQVYSASKELTSTFNKVIENTPAVMRVYEILDTPDTLPDGPGELPFRPLQEGIELRDVSFRYLESDVLSHVNLKIPAGKVVALVGPTGAGKTTLCDLVPRFFDVTGGNVLWDGVDVRDVTKASVMRCVGIVTQDAFLFNAPIDENIGYGRPEATQEMIEVAARDAFVHDDIIEMDGAYKKSCGERGTALSGGQRQRVTIARAILKNAPVLILDEATSNLDSKSESMVQAALARLMAGRTVIVVAHRLSTIRNADLIVVLEHGEVVERGAPDELLARPGSRFKTMYEMQTGERRAEPGKED